MVELVGQGVGIILQARERTGLGDQVAILTDGHLSGLVCKGLVVAEVASQGDTVLWTRFENVPAYVAAQDIPIHLGSLIPAMKSVARFFDGDIHEGDLILHNDPAYGGSHIIDTCMYYPVFYEGELVFWTVCKGHLTDIGGPVPAGYQ